VPGGYKNPDAEPYLFQDVSCAEKNFGSGIMRALGDVM